LCGAGKRGLLLRVPRVLGAEKHEYIREEIHGILAIRRSAYGEGGCPAAMFTDNIRRDRAMLLSELKVMFPAAMATKHTETLLCQDVIHRQWLFTCILVKMHADYSLASADIKSIFGRLT
jgi:hypothetical protein